MENFKSLVRDTLPMKNPPATWQLGRNMLIAKGFNSLANEDGFKFEYLIPGIVIGVITTSTEIVYFIKNKDGLDEIGKVNTNNDTPVYTPIIRSNLFDFKLNRPIEGVFIYNYKNELTVAWCDGTLEGSNTPKILNTSNPDIELKEDLTLVNDAEFNKLELFPKMKQGDLSIQYLDAGSLIGLTAYVTYAYVFNDNTATPYFSISDIAYLADGLEAGDRKGLRLNFTNLDPTFSKIKVGIVLKQDGNLLGYESYPITYTNGQKTVDVTSISNFVSTPADSIVIEKAIFEKIESLTKVENQVIAGKVVTKEPIKFQKYANLLKLKPTRYLDSSPQTPSLMPDEVYAMYIQLQYLDGTYSDAFHIPGDKATEADKAPLTPAQKEEYNAHFADNLDNVKNFHIFNKGNTLDYFKTFGVWENEETYPDLDDYNSSVDYEGKTLIYKVDDPVLDGAIGDDLRNTPIRYHRVPGLDHLAVMDGDNFGVANNIMLIHPAFEDEFSEGDDIKKEKRYYKLGVEVENFADIVPPRIKNQIQGYRICYVKRDNINNYVLGNWFATRRSNLVWKERVDASWRTYNFDGRKTGKYPNDINFDKLNLLSTELFKYRPAFNISYIKNNYLVRVNSINPIFYPSNEDKFAAVKDSIKYVPGNNMAAGTMYFEEAIHLDLDTENFNDFYTKGGEEISDDSITRHYIMNLTAFSYKTNLYTGFKSSNLAVLGRTSNLGNKVYFKGGDVFNNNEIDIVVHSPDKDPRYNKVDQNAVKITVKGFFSPLNAAILYTPTPEGEDFWGGDLIAVGSGYNGEVPVDKLNARDYEFEVKSEDGLNAINDINVIFTFDPNDPFINRFPFRIHKGIKIPNENLSSTALRTFLINDYYEMPNDKGELIAVRGTDRKLFVQMRFSLFVASIKDKLQTLNADAYLGQTELFDRTPDELLGDDKGYIGSVSKFACIVIKGMYITVNQVNGQIFTVHEGVKEISASGNRNWFRNNWDIGLDFYRIENEEKRRIDNPFVSVGHIVGYDKEYNRLLFTKKTYELIDKTLLENEIIKFDGEFFRLGEELIDFNNKAYIENKSKTLSYSLDNESWLFEHDYFPNIIFHDTNKLYSIVNILETGDAGAYSHNDKLNKGLYYGEKFPSYVDLIYNGKIEVSKMLHNITWVCDTIRPDGGNDQFSGITGIMVYNNNQCSGIINLRTYGELSRSLEGEWSANGFKDLVINPSSPILDDNGDVIESNINNLKLWFEKSNFISKFITVRLIIDNIDNNSVYIHKVNANSIISKR